MKVLIVYRDTIREALEHLDEFESKMDSFTEFHKKHTYTSSIKKLEDKWEIKVIVNDEKQTDSITT